MGKCRCTAVDGVVEDNGKILLIKRKRKPFKGLWALPGGFLEEENIWEGVVREVREETGYIVKPLFVVGIFSSPKRDPRGVVSIAIACQPLSKEEKKDEEEIEETKWMEIGKALKEKLAFDHKEILKRYWEIKGLGERVRL